MLGAKKSMAIMSVNDTTVNDAVNDEVLADEAKFTGVENMWVSQVDDMSLAVDSSGEIIINPSRNTEIKDYAVNYSVSTSYRDANGNSYGSWYFSVTEVVDAASASAAAFDRVTRVMLDTKYDETAAEGRKYADLAAEGKSYDDYGNEYIIVPGEDGYKTAVLNSKQLAENSSWPDAVVWCGSTPNYTLFARNELGQSIGSIKYSVTEIGAGT